MKEYGFNENDKLYTVEDGKVELLSDYDDSVHNSICCDCKFADGASAIHDEDKIYFIATLRKQSVIRTFDAEGNMETILDRQGSVHTLAKSGNTVYFTGMRDMGLTECYAFDGNRETKLTSFNDAVMAERSVCPVEEFTFTYKDLELDGYVIKPVNFDPDRRTCILTIHGGPRAPRSDLSTRARYSQMPDISYSSQTRLEVTDVEMNSLTLPESTAESTLNAVWRSQMRY